MDSGAVRGKMQSALDHLSEELQTLRSGRASTGLVENIQVMHYGQSLPLKALANITAPDAQTIIVAPWDPSATSAVEKAITEDKNLDLTPTSDGKTIYINIPPPTEERRQQLVKQVGEIAEQAHVSLRNIRHEALKDQQTQLKNKQISEDEFEQNKQQLDDLVGEFGSRVDEMSREKKQDIETV